MQDFKSYLMDHADKKNPMPLITTSMIQYPTSYMHLDYGCGSYLTVFDDEESALYNYHNIGITGGSVNVIISKTQGGKTSLAIGMASAILEPFINKMLYDRITADAHEMARTGKVKIPDMTGHPFIQVLDTEKTLPIDYAKKVARYTNKLTQNHIMINPITTDKDMIKIIEQHIKYKVESMNKIIMPMSDMFGRPIIDYPPTVIIVDSMSQLLLEDFDDISTESYEKMVQGTAGARRAKVISAMYSKLVNYAKSYNIIIFSINHINKMPAMNGIPVKQFRGLRGGETIGGGERAMYLAANILRLDVIKSVGGEASTSVNLGDDVKGHITIADWIKCKSNSKSNKCQIVYTGLAGYDPLLSSLWFAKENGTLAKSGNFFYLDNMEKIKFTLKNCREVFADNPEMITALYYQLRDKCSAMLDNPDAATKHNKRMLENIRADIKEDYKDSKSDAFDMDDIFKDLINGQ